MKSLIFFLFFINFSLLYGNDDVLYVKDFGAIANDKKDDTQAIQNCFKEALKYSKSKVVFTPGTYLVNKTIVIDCTKRSVEINGEIINGKQPEIISSSFSHIIHVRGFFSNPQTGTFRINNIILKGNNIPFSSTHPRTGKKEWSAAIAATDLDTVIISNVQIENFYGQGIYISTTDPINLPMKARVSNVEIINNKFINVWGSNPKFDDYGDAIYVANVSRGIIKDNYIRNNLLQTKQLGRCGIVLEYFCENVEIENNQILEGYDRPLHIENTNGGHFVNNNTFEGSDLGIVIVEHFNEFFKPVLISNNKISNMYLYKNMNFTKSYGEGSFGDRSLVFIATYGDKSDYLIKLNKNKIIVNNDFIYNSNSIMNLRSKNVIISNNIFQSTTNKNEYSIFNYGGSKVINNILPSNFSIK